jgi:hypothetical protein
VNQTNRKDEADLMRKLIGVWLIAISLVPSSVFIGLQAQEEKPAPEDSKAKAERRSDPGQQSPSAGEKPMHPYRADFLISELEDGKRINARHYSMLLNVGGSNEIKVGTKVPVSTSEHMFQYMDVGTRINCRLLESGDDLAIDVHSDFSSLSSPEDQHNSQPVVRQVTLSGNTLVTSGKPIIIGAADDPGSRHQFQLEATVTKLK